MQRLFSKKQRIAVEIVTGRTGEADHVTPYSKGGKTIVENCQIISQKANKMTGIEPKDIHKKFKPQKEMSLKDLEAKLAWLKSEVASCERN